MSRVVAIRMSESFIEISHLCLKKNRVKILEEFTIDFNTKIMSEVEIFEVDNIGYRIKKALQDHKIKTKKVIFSINSGNIIGRKVSVPKQKNDKDFLALLSTKVIQDNIFPISLDDYFITYSIIGSHIQTSDELKALEKKAEYTYIEDSDKMLEDLDDTADMDDATDESSDLKTVKSDVQKPVAVSNKKEKGVLMYDCMAYICAKTVIESINKIASVARLNLQNIEYAGNSLYQFVRKEYGEEATDCIIIHINDVNTIITVVSEGNVSSQRSIGFSYESVCKIFYDYEHVFHLDTPSAIFDFINNANFLDKESDFMSKFFTDLDINDPDDSLTISTIQSVQDMVIDSIIDFINKMNSLLAEIRTDGLKPNVVFYYNEANNFPDITDSIVHYSKLDLIEVENPDTVDNLLTYISVIKPIDFSIATNVDKTLNKRTNRMIICELIVATWVLALLTAFSGMKLGTASDKNRRLNAQLSGANTAKMTYLEYADAKSYLEDITVFDSYSATRLNRLDELLDYIESVTPKNRVIYSAFSGSDTYLSVDVLADSKDTVIKLVQGLEASGYFSVVKYANVTERVETTFATLRDVSATIIMEFDLSVPEETEGTEESVEDTELGEDSEVVDAAEDSTEDFTEDAAEEPVEVVTEDTTSVESDESAEESTNVEPVDAEASEEETVDVNDTSENDESEPVDVTENSNEEVAE